MRITGLGKLVLLLLVAGAAFGGWNAWKKMSGSGGTSLFPPTSINKNSGNANSGNAGNSNSNNSNNSSTQTSPVAATDSSGAVQIPFVITAAKKDWVGEQVDRFNAQNNGKYRIVTQAVPSREAMHSILSGNIKPVLWSPGSPVWPTRLSEAYSQKNGKTILDMSDPNAYRVFLRSPLVFLTTKKKSAFLKPLLSNNSWANLEKLASGQTRPPWGSFRFSHADPLTSSSGVMTMGLMLYDYSQRNPNSTGMTQLANSGNFVAYLKRLERGLVYDKAARDGTTKLTNAFLEDQTRYDVITAYESAALAAAPKNSNLTVIYPNPTAVSEHAVSLLSGEWVTPQQREGALAFMQFLGGRESLQGGLKYYFRPAQSGSSLSLSDTLSRFGSQGFQQSYSSVELPPYEALNAAAYNWHKRVVNE